MKSGLDPADNLCTYIVEEGSKPIEIGVIHT